MITAPLVFRQATDSPADLATLVGLYDGAARWMQENGIDQWKPGEKSEEHFRLRIKEGEVWLAYAEDADARETVAGAYELWWDDEPAWGEQPPVAGYVHRLMTHRSAPAGTGRALLAHAEERTAAAGRGLCRLDCVSSNPRLRTYYEHAGYTVVGEQPFKEGAGGSKYGVTLMERKLTG
ncbi:GNAT family N-acetyltransferase [Streptomyces sp. TRM66268-LWL]|uniref:GNAT family N-acetyltransferase n=1 Tax=Streptomyces polyasparticus TaxID=2767826 RepID=A0ABR7SCC8_9ACTN|nr:GNAT family N-acetyltransferase [Streptomyces polyasparticus]MBC9712390.1 GNAT family N-acetyltransferase [Streptomyces polyasparticus]